MDDQTLPTPPPVDPLATVDPMPDISAAPVSPPPTPVVSPEPNPVVAPAPTPPPDVSPVASPIPQPTTNNFVADVPPIPPTPTPPPAVPDAEPAKVNVVKKGGKKFNIFPILLILIILAVLGIGGYFLLGLLKKNQTITLTYWGLWEPASVVQPLIDEYEAAHPKVKITYQMESIHEYRERLQSALSQNRGPDIFRIHNSWIPMFKSDLSPVPATVYSASQYSATFYPVAGETLASSSRFLAVPLEYDGLVMYVNDQLLAQSGLPIPANWDELRSTAIAITRCETETGVCKPGDRVLTAGAALGLTDNVDHWQDILASLLLQNNVNLNAPSGRAAQDVLDYYSSFSKTLGIWEPTLSPSTALFEGGQLAIYFGPSWRYHEIRQANPELAFSVHPIPQAPIDPERDERPVTWATFWAEGVNAKSKNAAAAWDFMAFLSSKESLQKLYANEVSLGREFGEAYPRIDMQDLVQDNPVVSTVLSQAANSRSWYIASSTYDGPTGINTKLSTAFSNVLAGKANLNTLPTEINAILGQYGLGTPAPVAK